MKGEVIKTVPEAEIVATLIEEANRIAAEMGPDAPRRHRPGRHRLTRDPSRRSTMSSQLPAPVQAMVDAINAADTDAFVAAFTA